MRPNEILMKWALRPADNHSFCDGGEGSGHGFDAAQAMVGPDGHSGAREGAK